MFLTNEKHDTVCEINAFKDAGDFSLVDFVSPNSPGNPNEYYSEGDYWWPNPDTSNRLPYIRRDGLSNPEIFNTHRELLINMCIQVVKCATMYSSFGDKRRLSRMRNILFRWFIDKKTKMEPHLKYAQAIPGLCLGREVGIIDTLHLAETALVALQLKKMKAIVEIEFDLLMWFEEYLHWLLTHEHGRNEKKQNNNHATCWYLQAAAFATLTANQDVLNICRNDYKQILLPEQMAADGSFPYELRRTKPYCYSIFNLEAMAALCQLLSCPGDNLFEYQTADGLSLRSGIEFIYPYLVDKNSWPYGRDIEHWDSWPNKQPCLLFAGMAYNESKYLELWRKMPVLPRDFEAVRNTPVKNPELWMKNALNY